MMASPQFVICYPIYIDSTKTIRQGRRTPMKDSVTKPTAKEIHHICCQDLKLDAILEPLKAYPRSQESQAAVLEHKFCEQMKWDLVPGTAKAGGRVRIVKNPLVFTSRQALWKMISFRLLAHRRQITPKMTKQKQLQKKKKKKEKEKEKEKKN